MNNDLIKIDYNDILYEFEVDGKEYVALYDKEDDDSVYFALVINLDEYKKAYIRVPDADIDKVIEEFDRQMNEFNEFDELDEEESEDVL